MVLVLSRTYFPDGTNGKLECEGKFICNTIELPWKKNETKVSCIPERKYFIKKRFSQKLKWHLEVMNVENRSLILIHPANNALLELEGCIAPVTQFSGPGLGLKSKQAFQKLKDLVFKVLDRGEEVSLIIQSDSKLEFKKQNYEYHKKNTSPNPNVF